MNHQLLQIRVLYLLFITTFPAIATEIIPNNISGTWVLNIQLSDDYQEKVKEQIKYAKKYNRNKTDGYTGASPRSGRGNSGGRPLGNGSKQPINVR